MVVAHTFPSATAKAPGLPKAPRGSQAAELQIAEDRLSGSWTRTSVVHH
jgi:hypothetical protein